MNLPDSQPRPTAPSPAEPVPDEYDVLCENCGYSLVGLLSDRCPECGTAIDVDLPLARIPWLYRIRIGCARSYARTVSAIVRNPHAFARELSRPVRISAKDAFAFRRLTIRIIWWLIVLATVATVAFALRWQSINLPSLPQRVLIPYEVFVGAFLFAAWMFLWLATDLPTFIWRGLPSDPQNLAPLHHYACAPLVLMPGAVLLGAAVIGAAYAVSFPDKLMWIMWFLGAIPLAELLWTLWRIPQIFMREATKCTRTRQLAMAIYLPFHWTLIAALGCSCVIIAIGVMVILGYYRI